MFLTKLKAYYPKILFISLMIFFLYSCADIHTDLARNEIEKDYRLYVKDTIVSAVKDSIYRHYFNSLSSGNLYIGKFRDIEASILIAFTNFDSLILDTVSFDSFRVDTTILKFHSPKNIGLYSDQIIPFPINFSIPTTNWEENTVVFDSILSNCSNLSTTWMMPVDTVGVDTVQISFSNELNLIVQNWISNAKRIRTSNNYGLWLKADSFATYSMRSFYSNEALDSLKPTLIVTLSKMRNGVPIANPIRFVTKATKATSFVRPPTTLPQQLMVGSGDAIRGIVWFQFDALLNRNIIIHQAKLKLTRMASSESFGISEAINLYYPANDSISWSSEPNLYPANIQSTPLDSVVLIDAKFPVSRWVRQGNSQVALIITDASEDIKLSRTTFYGTNSIYPPQLQIIYSEVNENW